MAIKTIEYEINVAGITPANEQFGGTQGDHNVTSLNIGVADELLNGIEESVGLDKAMYRFDVYDGQGGVWQSAPQLLQQNLTLMLEERHTRYGGKITVYLVITVLSEDGVTEMELYSFPMMLRLKNRPEGECRDGENYESVVSLADVAFRSSNSAAVSAASAKTSAKNAQAAATEATAVLENVNAVITESTDQTYSPASQNPQSGKAVAEALTNHYTKDAVDNLETNLNRYIANIETDVGRLWGTVGDFETAIDELHNYAQANTWELIEDITLTEDVSSVEFSASLDGYKSLSLFVISEFANANTVAMAIRENGGTLYFMWNNFTFRNTEPLAFWHLIEETGRINNVPLYKSTYPKLMVRPVATSARGVTFVQGLADSNIDVKSDTTFNPEGVFRKYNIFFPNADNSFKSGGKFYLLGRR